MASLFILRKHPRAKYPRKRPLRDFKHLEKHSHCVSGLSMPGGGELSWNNKSAANSNAQAWALHYYVPLFNALY
jgi:hypothetical protein